MPFYLYVDKNAISATVKWSVPATNPDVLMKSLTNPITSLKRSNLSGPGVIPANMRGY